MEFYRLPEQVKTRWASPENPRGIAGGGGRLAHGRKGMPYFFVRPGRPLTIASVQGHSGIIRRIWLTFHDLSPLMLRQLRLQFFWDGAAKAAVDVPLGDFFGMSLGRMVPFAGSLFSSPEGRSLICTVPMPFRRQMRLVLQNDGVSTAAMFYYDVNYTLDDDIPADAGYFHAWYNQETPTRLREDYTILPEIKGRGRFLGACFGVRMNRALYADSWGGEGEVKFYLDGDGDHPTLCGTGTEDYFGTGWCQGVFDHPHCGCPIADSDGMLLGFYRYHVPDPVYFQTAIRVTIQQIGSWNPVLLRFFTERGSQVWQAGLKAQEPPQAIDPADPGLPDFDLFERSDNWNSCCYFYLDKPETDLPPPPDWQVRARALPDFAEEELTSVKNDFPQVRILRKYLPDLDALELPQLTELAAALNQVVGFLTLQEQQLSDAQDAGAAGEGPEQ
jgi:hypothetical protein